MKGGIKMKQSNKTVWVIGIVVIIIALILIVSLYPLGNKNIKIGIIGHFSGDYASYGIPMKNAAELAIEETNNAGGINGKQIELIVEDDSSDPVKAASAMNKLVSIDNVDYILSAQGSGVTSVITPIAESNSKILMITLGSAPGLASGNNYVYRSTPSDVYQASQMTDYMNNNLKPQKIAGIYRNDAYGIGIKEIIEDRTSAEVVAGELFESNNLDFKTSLTKIKQANPDVLIIAGASDSYPLLLKQIGELGITAKIFASETFYDEKVLDSSENTEGVYTIFQEDPKDYVNFKSKYVQRFGEEPSAYSMYAYDGTISLIKALETTDDNINQVKDKLHSIKFNGASGEIGFDSEGDRTGVSYAIYKVVNGKFVKQ